MKFYSGLMPAIRRALGLALVSIVLCQPCLAQVPPVDPPVGGAPGTITSVQILPQAPITPADQVILTADYDLDFLNFEPVRGNVSFVSPNDILFEITAEFPDPAATVITPGTIDGLLGDLAPGEYDFTIQLFYESPSLPLELQDSFSGSFTVVPEPASFATLILFGLILPWRRGAV